MPTSIEVVNGQFGLKKLEHIERNIQTNVANTQILIK